MANEIELHSRIALKEGLEKYYPETVPRSEAWARGYKIDDDGFEMVNVEWDEDHWRYQEGSENGWTYAEHFEVIGEPVPPTEESEVSDVDIQPEPEPVGPTEEQIEQFIETMSEAMEAASESESFVVITVKRVPNPEEPGQMMMVPQVFHESISNDAEALLEIQMMEIAGASYQQAVMAMLEKLRNE
jgi:hypothetical protein